ncbi:GNAT family N-acetyltransferase [Asanoa sp. WMMD1127]|uniref:GNAT family N-acetyltransferase n=1 Tax=Asanoa sp. WMMD1127 TaxID=3016107 RepID=UPI0024175C94|nr:GNAT family N-acetyltransferase [Asanoa sp. WMMD1127]MDG4824226.1 GNAT family N-acetyltransferase [Asanoa sp. WMMD1127]
MRIRVDGAASPADGVALWPAYDEIFGDHPSFESWRDGVWDRHRRRSGFRLARALTAGGTLVGFAYGYTGEPGQWWTDNARAALPPDVADAWLGGHFELVSIGVVAAARGRGIGRRLLRTLLDATDHDRLLLMTTADADDPARRLYAAEGWQVIGPGIGAATVIMGRRR